ncbi:tectonin domain-containing protein [Micromonospora sp. RP3T]|uniref:tectonin domain-containing protein n=1 Tax=Micromonospora sp. RP3T TaxID=2135446 RepID=UPI000D167AC9|nr:tectonin domain-containing protein [Micromonospora sp. RP3T]PTA43234.1 hypothetical protein C8054_26600 [Micromonospora sp. RP3T]
MMVATAVPVIAAPASPAFAEPISFDLGTPALTRNALGAMELFATDGADRVWHRWQSGPGSAWSGWSQLDGSLRSVAAQSNGTNDVELFGINDQGLIWHRWQLPGGGWSSWTSIEGELTSLAVARNQDNRMELFGTNNLGQVWHRAETTAGSHTFGPWALFNDGLMRTVAAETNEDGRVELFALNDAGEIFHRAQTRPAGWSAWAKLDGTLKSLAVAKAADGRLELFGANAAEQMWHRRQIDKGGAGWTGWDPVPGQARTMAAEADANGRIAHVVMNGAGESLVRAQQQDGWSDFTKLAGDLAPLYWITHNTQAELFANAVTVPNAIIKIVGDVNLDLSGREFIRIAAGVQILGDTSVHPRGPRLFTTSFPRVLFQLGHDPAQVTSDNVRISGIRLDGGQGEEPAETEEEDSDAIRIFSSRNVQIDHSELYGWRGSTVLVDDGQGRLGKDDDPASMVRVVDNYMHHNQHQTGDIFGGGHGGGYGVAVRNGGFVLIERNVFDWNRHAVAGDGREGSGYRMYNNLVLPNGGWNTDVYHTHMIDMHARDSCGLSSYNCGLAGEFMDIKFNTILYSAGTGIKLRGTPSIGMYVSNNVFTHRQEFGSALDDAAMVQNETGLHASANTFGFNATTGTRSTVCDFDGDGTNDTFLASGANWWYQSATLGWHHLRQSTITADKVTAFGDRNGDGRCDVTANGTVHPTAG